MENHARRTWPQECCGVVLGTIPSPATARDAAPERTYQGLEALPSDNIAEGDRTQRYQIDWSVLLRAYKKARREELEVIGFYHSHPGGTAGWPMSLDMGKPSDEDRRHALPGRVYLILPIKADKVEPPGAWRFDDGGLPGNVARIPFKIPILYTGAHGP